MLGVRDIDAAKALVATLALLVLVLRQLPGWPAGRAGRRTLDAALLAAGLLGVLCWTNLLQFNGGGFGHPSETFHYYLGSKYFRELGYTRLYRCVAVAEAEAGRAESVRVRRMRDLETNRLAFGADALEDPSLCKRHFEPERWRAFRRDLAWFRDRPTPRGWRVAQTDHGYNATPAWGWIGSWVANRTVADDRSILAVRLLDPLLLAAGFAVFGWGFGWRALCAALVFFGTNYPAQYGWTGGGFLRQLDLAAVLAGVALLRRGWTGAAGGLLALAALVRVHPALLLLGPGLQVLVESVRARRLALGREHRRLLAGGLVCAAVVVPLSALQLGGGAWSGFVANSRVLLGTPLRNDFGLATVFAWSPDRPARELLDPTLDDPYQPWKQQRLDTFEQRRALFVLCVAGFVGLLAWSVRGQPAWMAVSLAAGLVPIAAELPCYYVSILTVLAAFERRDPWIAVGLVGLSAAGWALVEVFHFFDDILPAISAATALFLAFATFRIGRGRDRRTPPRPSGP